VQAKIRDAQLELIPYMAVVGPREAETGSIALRDRIDGDIGAKPVDEVLAMLQNEVTTRRIRQVVAKPASQSDEPTQSTSHEY